MTDKVTRPRVVVAGDHCGIVNEIAGLLRPEFDVVATTNNGISALDCILRLDPDIVLLDLYMPGMNGLDVVRTLKSSATITAVIMSGYDDRELAQAAIAAGATAFVAKPRVMQDLLPALRGAVRGCVFVSARLSDLPPRIPIPAQADEATKAASRTPAGTAASK